MENILYTYGTSDYLFYVFDAIARILNSQNTVKLVGFLSLVGFMYIVAKNLLQGKDGSSLKTQAMWVGKYVFMTGVLMAPVGSVVIQDVITKTMRKVDNLPVGLSLPVGIFGSVGHAITMAFEKNFTPVNYLPYHQYGMVFGSQVVAEAKNMKIEDPIFWENMYNFMNQCVKYDALIGTKYTMRDLKNSTNIWKLITEKASTFFMFEYRKVGGVAGYSSTRERVTCRDGGALLSKEWTIAYDTSLRSLSSSLLSLNGKSDVSKRVNAAGNERLKKILEANLQNGIIGLGSGLSAEEYLKQHMMIDSVRRYGSSFRPDGGHARATEAYMSSLIAPGKIAGQTLPLLKGAIEMLVYGAFPFVFFMLMLPGGGGILLKYCGILYWLQLWAPLYALLNMMMSLMSYQLTGDQFESGINMANINSVANTHQWIVAFSGYLSSAIPFIAKIIVDYSGHGMVQLVSSVTGSMQASAAGVANEVLSGNMNLDNRNVGNLQYANTNAFKSDTSSSSRGSSAEWQMPDGALERVQTNGDIMTMSGEGITTSSGHTRISSSDGITASIGKSMADNSSQIEALSSEIATSEQNTFGKAANYFTRVGENRTGTESFDYITTGEEGKAVAKAMDFTKILHDDYNYSWEQASNATLAVSLGNGGKGAGSGGGGDIQDLLSTKKQGGVFKKSLLGVAASALGLEVNARGDVAASSSNRQSLQELQEIANKHGFSESYNDIIRGSMSEQFNKSNNIEKGLNNDLSESYQKTESKHQALQDRIEIQKQYSEQISHARNSSITFDRNKFGDMQKWLMDEKGMGPHKARRVAEGGSTASRQYSDEYEKGHVASNRLMTNAERMENNLDLIRAEKGKQGMHSLNVNRNVGTGIRKYAEEQGLNIEGTNINPGAIQEKINGLNDSNREVISATRGTNHSVNNKMQDEVDKLEDGRILTENSSLAKLANKVNIPSSYVSVGRTKPKTEVSKDNE